MQFLNFLTLHVQLSRFSLDVHLLSLCLLLLLLKLQRELSDILCILLLSGLHLCKRVSHFSDLLSCLLENEQSVLK